MAPRIEVIKGTASQRIVFDPPEGRPTSTPSVQIKDQSGGTITAASTTGVTLDTVSTTVSVASSVGDLTLTLTSAAGITFRGSYLVTNASGQREWVRVRGVNASTKVVTLDEALRFAHDTAATFVGCSFYRTLTAAEVANLVELYRARATYVVGGLPYVMEVAFDVVTTPLSNPLTVEFLKSRRSDIMAFEPAETRGTDFADLRERAFEEVKRGIRRAGFRPALLHTPEDIEEWAVSEFWVLAAENGVKLLAGWDPKDAMARLEQQRDGVKARCLASLDFIDQGADDDARGEEDEKPLRMNLTR